MKTKIFLAVFLNFLTPGLGYAYLGNLKKGLVSYGILVLLAVAVRFYAFTFELFVIGLSSVILYGLYARR